MLLLVGLIYYNMHIRIVILQSARIWRSISLCCVLLASIKPISHEGCWKL